MLGVVVTEEQAGDAEAGRVAHRAVAAEAHQRVEAAARLVVGRDQPVAVERVARAGDAHGGDSPELCHGRLQVGPHPAGVLARHHDHHRTAVLAGEAGAATGEGHGGAARAVPVGAVDSGGGDHDGAVEAGAVTSYAVAQPLARGGVGLEEVGEELAAEALLGVGDERAKSSTSAVTSAPRSSVRRPARSSGSSRRRTRVATCSVRASAAATSPDPVSTERPDVTASATASGTASGRAGGASSPASSSPVGVHTDTAPWRDAGEHLGHLGHASATDEQVGEPVVGQRGARRPRCAGSGAVGLVELGEQRAFSSATTAWAAKEVEQADLRRAGSGAPTGAPRAVPRSPRRRGPGERRGWRGSAPRPPPRRCSPGARTARPRVVLGEVAAPVWATRPRRPVPSGSRRVWNSRVSAPSVTFM